MKTIKKKKWLLTVTIIAALTLPLSVAFAQGKGKGGGGRGGAGQNGGGVIYYTYQSDLYEMNDDGSGKTLVAGFPEGFSAYGDPSRQLHAGKRWFAQVIEYFGDFYPDFHPDGTIKDFAYRKDLIVLSDGGDVVPLQVPPELELLEAPRWTVGDSYLSWAGREWVVDESNPGYGTVVEGGLYVTQLLFDGDGNVSGVGASSLLVPMTLVPSNAWRQYNDFTPGPDMYSHDWAPDGMQFVVERIATEALSIGNIAGEFRVLFADPLSDYVGRALWSPRGDRVMFQYNPDIGHTRVMLINPDGSGLQMLVRSAPSWTRTLGVWSPTGSHLLYQHWDHFFDDSYILRATAEGSGKTRITEKSLGVGHSTPRAIGWRGE